MIARRMGFLSAAVAFAALSAAGCGPSAEPPGATAGLSGSENSEPPARETRPVAVASPYLEAAVVDLLGAGVPLVRLASPGACPGHYDIRPSRIVELSKCRLLVRFDFQAGMDKMLDSRGIDGRRIAAVAAVGGLCVPDTYLAVCRQLAERFIADGDLSRSDADARLAGIERRAAALREEAIAGIDAAGLRGAPVLCSGHQAEFCRWLGLRVAAEFPAADAASTGALDRAVADADGAGVRLVVANQPEGRRAADALADRLRARVVVFANFPEPGIAHAFDALVRRNLVSLTARNNEKTLIRE